MAVELNTQPYRGIMDTKSHKFVVLVSCTPVVKSPRSSGMSEFPDLSKHSTARPLHFVNADAATIGTRNPRRGTREVKSHLSGHYRRWKKQQTLSLQAASEQQERSTEIANTSVVSRGRRIEASKSPVTVTSSNGSSSSPNTDSSPKKAAPQRVVQQIAGTASLQDALSYGNSDPFSAFPVAVDPQTNLYIQIFHEGTNIMCWTKAIDPRFKNLLQAEATMHGVLAVAKCLAALYLPWRQGSSGLLPESRQHYGELLRLMRTDFGGQATVDPEHAIEMVHAATIFSFLAREYSGFELHLKRLKTLIDDMGGLRTVDRRHSLRFLNAERIRGLFLLREPLADPAEWAPGSWSQQDHFRLYDQGHERGRHLMSSLNIPILPEGVFADSVQNLILDYRDMLSGGSVAAALARARQPGVDSITDWLNLRSQALSLRATQIMIDINRAKMSRPSLRLSLHASASLSVNFISHLIYYAYKPTIGLSYIPIPVLLENLQEIAGYIDRGARLQHQDLYLWTLFVGACTELASRTWSCDARVRGSTWCSTNLALMIEKLGINTLQEFQTNLRQFVFPVMFFPYAKALFEKRHDLIRLAT